MKGFVNTATDYSIFQIDSKNRAVSIPQVNKLRKSMHQNGFLKSFPISCTKSNNGKLIVTDGQHRLQAAKLLGIPVLYVIEDISVDPASVPTQKKWSVSDYLSRHAAAGRQPYITIMNIAKHYGVSHRTSAALLTNDINGARANEFNNGNAKIRTFEWACIALDGAKKSCEINKDLLMNPLSIALYRISVLTEIDYTSAVSRIASNADQMNRFNAVVRGYEEMEKAYNFRMHIEKRLPLAMIINKQLMLRKRTFGKGK